MTASGRWTQTSPQQVTAEEVAQIRLMLQTLKQVVDEYGHDYVYQARFRFIDGIHPSSLCMYVHDDQPDCLAAKVLHRLGVSVATLRLYEEKGCDQIGLAAAPHLGVRALRVLRVAQIFQDEGQSWGHAYGRAVEYASVDYGIDVSTPEE